MCSTYRRCQSSAWVDCLNDCQAQNRAFFSRISDASLELQAECLQSATCTSDLDAMIDQCFLDTRLALEPSLPAVELCEAMAKPFFECSWFTTPQSCGTFHAVFSAPALAAEQDCAEANCEQLAGCIDSHLFAFGE